ncbi:hypothetical protein FRB90_012772 [Tulasnella sp. 427]|nr:hypothetical protein FRB90_012772 [Tulasnella sp. 427]
MNGQSAVNQATTTAQSSSQGLPGQSQVSIANKVVSLKDDVISTLETTVWPERSTDAKDTFLRSLRDARNLKNVPIDEACISVGHRQALENLVRENQGYWKRFSPG